MTSEGLFLLAHYLLLASAVAVLAVPRVSFASRRAYLGGGVGALAAGLLSAFPDWLQSGRQWELAGYAAFIVSLVLWARLIVTVHKVIRSRVQGLVSHVNHVGGALLFVGVVVGGSAVWFSLGVGVPLMALGCLMFGFAVSRAGIASQWTSMAILLVPPVAAGAVYASGIDGQAQNVAFSLAVAVPFSLLGADLARTDVLIRRPGTRGERVDERQL